MFYYDVAPFNVAEVPEPFNQGFEIGTLFLGTASVPKHPDYRNSSRLLRTRREWPRRRAAEHRDELAPFHCPMPPVLPTERIAHRSRDCCAAGFRSCLWPVRVMNGPKATSALSPFDSQLRTLVGAARRSH